MLKQLVVFFMLCLPLVAKAEVTIGLINLQKVLATIKEGKDVNDKLKKTFDEKKAILTKDEDKIKKEQEDYVKQAALLSADAKRAKEVSIQQAINALQKKTGDYQKDMSEMEANLKKPILDKLKTIIEEISEESKVDLTIEVSASPVVYAKNKKDITDLVVTAYDKKNKK